MSRERERERASRGLQCWTGSVLGLQGSYIEARGIQACMVSVLGLQDFYLEIRKSERETETEQEPPMLDWECALSTV